MQKLEAVKPKQCSIETDSEYKRIVAESKTFFPAACGLVGSSETAAGLRRHVEDNQLALAAQIDNAMRSLSLFAAQDFRGASQKDFKVDQNPDLDDVRDAFMAPASTIEEARQLQAVVDEIPAWASDLHKKYDYSPSSSDGGSASAALPPIVPGALTVAPTEVAVSLVTLDQVVRISSGGQAGTFTAASNVPWLLLSKTDTAAGEEHTNAQ